MLTYYDLLIFKELNQLWPVLPNVWNSSWISEAKHIKLQTVSSTSFKKNEDHSSVTTTISFVSKCWPMTVPANNKPSLTWVNCITAFWTMLYYSPTNNINDDLTNTTTFISGTMNPMNHHWRYNFRPWSWHMTVPFPSFMESVTWVPRTGVYDHGKGYDYRCSHSCRTLEACWGTVWIWVQERVPKFLWQIKGALNCDICCPPARRNK